MTDETIEEIVNLFFQEKGRKPSEFPILRVEKDVLAGHPQRDAILTAVGDRALKERRYEEAIQAYAIAGNLPADKIRASAESAIRNEQYGYAALLFHSIGADDKIAAMLHTRASTPTNVGYGEAYREIFRKYEIGNERLRNRTLALFEDLEPNRYDGGNVHIELKRFIDPSSLIHYSRGPPEASLCMLVIETIAPKSLFEQYATKGDVVNLALVDYVALGDSDRLTLSRTAAPYMERAIATTRKTIDALLTAESDGTRTVQDTTNAIGSVLLGYHLTSQPDESTEFLENLAEKAGTAFERTKKKLESGEIAAVQITGRTFKDGEDKKVPNRAPLESAISALEKATGKKLLGILGEEATADHYAWEFMFYASHGVPRSDIWFGMGVDKAFFGPYRELTTPDHMPAGRIRLVNLMLQHVDEYEFGQYFDFIRETLERTGRTIQKDEPSRQSLDRLVERAKAEGNLPLVLQAYNLSGRRLKTSSYVPIIRAALGDYGKRHEDAEGALRRSDGSLGSAMSVGGAQNAEQYAGKYLIESLRLLINSDGKRGKDFANEVAQQLFSNQHYDLAKQCYILAGNASMAAVAGSARKV